MNTNVTPNFDLSMNTTGCCPKFNPGGWDNRHLNFEDKLFVRETSRHLFHFPLNMGAVLNQTQRVIDDANAGAVHQTLVLSREVSVWASEHYFAVTKSVLGAEMVELSGEYLTRVFEGPHHEFDDWSA